MPEGRVSDGEGVTDGSSPLLGPVPMDPGHAVAENESLLGEGLHDARGEPRGAPRGSIAFESLPASAQSSDALAPGAPTTNYALITEGAPSSSRWDLPQIACVALLSIAAATLFGMWAFFAVAAASLLAAKAGEGASLPPWLTWMRRCCALCVVVPSCGAVFLFSLHSFGAAGSAAAGDEGAAYALFLAMLLLVVTGGVCVLVRWAREDEPNIQDFCVDEETMVGNARANRGDGPSLLVEAQRENRGRPLSGGGALGLAALLLFACVTLAQLSACSTGDTTTHAYSTGHTSTHGCWNADGVPTILPSKLVTVYVRVELLAIVAIACAASVLMNVFAAQDAIEGA